MGEHVMNNRQKAEELRRLAKGDPGARALLEELAQQFDALDRPGGEWVATQYQLGTDGTEPPRAFVSGLGWVVRCSDAERYVHALAGHVVTLALVDRFKLAARTLVRERTAYAEDVETLADVLHVLESYVADPDPRGDAATVKIAEGLYQAASVGFTTCESRADGVYQHVSRFNTLAELQVYNATWTALMLAHQWRSSPSTDAVATDAPR